MTSFPFGTFLVEEKGEQFTRGKSPPISLTPEISGAFSPDDQVLATAGSDGTVKFWEPTTGKPLGKIESGASCCQCVSFSADGETLAVAADRDVQLWNVVGRKLEHTCRGHSDYVRSVVFSSDGKTLVSCSSDGTVMLWDTDSSSARAVLRGHYGGVSCVAISPDDKTVASAGRDGTIKLWDLESGEEKTTLTGHVGWVTSVAFAPDGRTLISGGEDGTVRLWKGTSDIPGLKTQTATAAREKEDGSQPKEPSVENIDHNDQSESQADDARPSQESETMNLEGDGRTRGRLGNNSKSEDQGDYGLGVTRVYIDNVRGRNPAGELESKTRYLNARELALVQHADQEELESTNYFVIKFLRPAQYRICVTCRAEGNHQVVAHSPRSKSLPWKSFPGVKEPKTLELDFDAADSRYLIMNCGTPGSLYVDAVSIEETKGQDPTHVIR